MFLKYIGLLLAIASGAELFRDTVSRTCATHRANLVMDGLSEVHGNRILRECPKNVKMTILLRPSDLRNEKLDRIVHLAIHEGHTLAYRLSASYDQNFQKIDSKKLKKNLLDAKKTFSDQYRYDLRWVFFPPSNYDLAAQTKAACSVELMNFGNSIFVDSSFARTKKSAVEQEIRTISQGGQGPIIYFNGKNRDVLDDMEVVYGYLHKYRLEPYTLDRCIP